MSFHSVLVLWDVLLAPFSRLAYPVRYLFKGKLSSQKETLKGVCMEQTHTLLHFCIAECASVSHTPSVSRRYPSRESLQSLKKHLNFSDRTDSWQQKLSLAYLVPHLLTVDRHKWVLIKLSAVWSWKAAAATQGENNLPSSIWQQLWKSSKNTSKATVDLLKHPPSLVSPERGNYSIPFMLLIGMHQSLNYLHSSPTRRCGRGTLLTFVFPTLKWSCSWKFIE